MNMLMYIYAYMYILSFDEIQKLEITTDLDNTVMNMYAYGTVTETTTQQIHGGLGRFAHPRTNPNLIYIIIIIIKKRE